MTFDIIGDIHGHADALKALLVSMGYRETSGAWRHPDRQAIFVGDLIDRGPKQVETVDIVRRMVDAGSAQAIMGNHELNAIAWLTPDPAKEGEYLRPHHSARHGDKNFRQHEAFLREVNGAPAHKEFVDWFRTLPLWLDLPGLRVVHACWHPDYMRTLEPMLGQARTLPESLLVDAFREPEDDALKDNGEFSVFKAVDAITKGLEVPLPGDHTFKDKDGHVRRRVRIKWWLDGSGTFRDVALLSSNLLEQLPGDACVPAYALPGAPKGKPTFFGHYWFQGDPRKVSESAACVDYSVAAGGKLVAYRWHGEPAIDDGNFHWVGKPASQP